MKTNKTATSHIACRILLRILLADLAKQYSARMNKIMNNNYLPREVK